MCARYCYFASEDFKDRFETENYGPDFKSFNIAPGTINPTIIRESPNQVAMMKWGLIPFWTKDISIGNKLINARSEGIESKPSFRRPIREHRCLVPANGFYEWITVRLEPKPEKFPSLLV